MTFAIQFFPFCILFINYHYELFTYFQVDIFLWNSNLYLRRQLFRLFCRRLEIFVVYICVLKIKHFDNSINCFQHLNMYIILFKFHLSRAYPIFTLIMFYNIFYGCINDRNDSVVLLVIRQGDNWYHKTVVTSYINNLFFF